ncbi:TPA: DUF551 domain-containing protein [Escherichia coli]|uniref:DUF551 domain-containing protein n=2 Tax=Escherichia coli TaxID=562 RepID=A0AAP8AL86_ECOLX|nr:DUF551 domain-containing protein [Escherichia coli]ECD4245653.1 DUF551 domain-containing protein [Salmonella enterica subsp. enterica serovar Virchow]MLP78564.1 DUF551 domain-containing protein [Salmonella enterica subsp. enterica]HBE1060448.1 DUF551 domain-containing protein [Salmonella enterica subsp. enterica serovar 4,[5],12:i:-]EFJ1151786.1 DUF551 domain-containing protein [Escherichia coli]EGA8978122.1 DUF551 domain-containing protein [Escherichia coli]
MTTITKERLLTIKQWRETYGPGSNVVLPAEEAEELARIALASLEADPVKRVNSDQMHRVCLEANRYLDKYDAMAKEVNKLLGRIAPPAPVLPHEWRLSNAQAFIERYSPPSVEEAALFAWNSCRAAMLHGAEPVSQTYKLNELAGNYPVTPDGWISCSERMPDSKTAVLVAREFDRKGDWRMKWATYIPGHPDANDGWIIPGASWKPSHWMPLPEPPQEVNQ